MPDRNKNKPSTKLDLDVLGTSGLKQFGGIVDEEWHPKLKGDFGPKLYREMADNSSAIGAIRYIWKALVRQVEWRVEPGATDKKGTEAAEFLESCILDMSHTFEDFISEVLSFLDYGWSYFEVIYKLRKGDTKDPSTRSQFNDGKIGWRKLALRAQDTLERWEFGEDGGLKGMHQLDQSAGVAAFVPIEKAILFRTETTKDNPEGRSIFRNAVVDYFFLKRISTIEAIGIERDMTGLLTMQVPLELLVPNATSEAVGLRTTLSKMLSELKRDEREFAMVPCEIDKNGNKTGFKLELLSTGGSRQININETKMYYKISILQSVMAQFIQLGMGNVGSWALASSQTNMFSMALGAYLNIIQSTFNRFAVSPLMQLNGFDREVWPELVHGDIEAPPLAEIGSYIQALAASGQLPTDEALQRKLLEFARLPQPEIKESSQVRKSSRVKGGPVLKTYSGAQKILPL